MDLTRLKCNQSRILNLSLVAVTEVTVFSVKQQNVVYSYMNDIVKLLFLILGNYITSHYSSKLTASILFTTLQTMNTQFKMP